MGLSGSPYFSCVNCLLCLPSLWPGPFQIERTEYCSSREQEQGHNGEEVASIFKWLRVQNRWAACRPPVEECEFGGPTRGGEKENGQQPAEDRGDSHADPSEVAPAVITGRYRWSSDHLATVPTPSQHSIRKGVAVVTGAPATCPPTCLQLLVYTFFVNVGHLDAFSPRKPTLASVIHHSR